MIEDLITNIWQWTNSVPPSWQFLAVFVAGAIPFFEGHGAVALGIAVGVNPVLATGCAILGNFASMLAFASMSDRLRTRLVPSGQVEKAGEKQDRLQRLYNKYGVPIVSIVAEVWLPSALTTVLLVSFGASKRQVIVWQMVSICLWTIGMALAVTGVITIFT